MRNPVAAIATLEICFCVNEWHACDSIGKAFIKTTDKLRFGVNVLLRSYMISITSISIEQMCRRRCLRSSSPAPKPEKYISFFRRRHNSSRMSRLSRMSSFRITVFFVCRVVSVIRSVIDVLPHQLVNGNHVRKVPSFVGYAPIGDEVDGRVGAKCFACSVSVD